MKKVTLAFIITAFFFASNAQTQIQMHGSFAKDKELQDAILKFDMAPFVKDNVVFVFDTIEREVPLKELNSLLKSNLHVPKNGLIKKASETNNGYVQTYGIYKNDDAIVYIRFTMNQISGMLEEVSVEKNN